MTKRIRVGTGALIALGLASGASAQTDLVGDRSALGWASDMAGPLDGADPSAALEAADTPQARALFTVLARQGCRVDPRTMQRVLAPEGFEYQAVSRVLTDLVVNGVAGTDADGVIQIPVALCPPTEPAASPRQTVVDAFGANGCTLDEAALRGADGVGDLSDAQLTGIVGGLIEAGDLTVEGRSATLAGCGDAAEES